MRYDAINPPRLTQQNTSARARSVHMGGYTGVSLVCCLVSGPIWPAFWQVLLTLTLSHDSGSPPGVCVVLRGPLRGGSLPAEAHRQCGDSSTRYYFVWFGLRLPPLITVLLSSLLFHRVFSVLDAREYCWAKRISGALTRGCGCVRDERRRGTASNTAMFARFLLKWKE